MRDKMKEHEIGTLRTKNKPQILSNFQKGNFFKTSYQFFKEWNEKSDKEKESINPMERMGIYCLLYVGRQNRVSLVELFFCS